MKWRIRAVTKGGKIIELETVIAKHQPAALQAAWKQWPIYVRDDVQGGFSALPIKETIK